MEVVTFDRPTWVGHDHARLLQKVHEPVIATGYAHCEVCRDFWTAIENKTILTVEMIPKRNTSISVHIPTAKGVAMPGRGLGEVDGAVEVDIAIGYDIDHSRQAHAEKLGEGGPSFGVGLGREQILFIGLSPARK